jgi:hypothetical protein
MTLHVGSCSRIPPRSHPRDEVVGLRQPPGLELSGELGDDVPAASLRGTCQRHGQPQLPSVMARSKMVV